MEQCPYCQRPYQDNKCLDDAACWKCALCGTVYAPYISQCHCETEKPFKEFCKCGGEIEHWVLMTYPPKYVKSCKVCGQRVESYHVT
jgi:hypothetical protein